MPAAGLTCLLHRRNHVWQAITLFVGLKSAKFEAQVPCIEGVPLGHHFFLVLKGAITIKMGDGDARLSARELHVVPKGVAHGPVAEEEGHILLIEPTGTANNGSEEAAAARVFAHGVRTFFHCLLPKQGNDSGPPNPR